MERWSDRAVEWRHDRCCRRGRWQRQSTDRRVATHVKYFYTIPTATLLANPPNAHCQTTTTPGHPDWSLVVVESWNDPISQDTWEALPQCTEHHIWNWGVLVPPLFVTAFGAWGITATDTIGDAMKKIRAL